MSSSLPATPDTARRLTEVLPQLITAVDGETGWFPRARSAVVVVVDGLGRANLAARRGHARFLAPRLTKRAVAHTVFPSTTAVALTGLLTGVDAGTHGIVGYRVRIPGTDQAPDQLKGWETDGLDPLAWQRSQPLLEREARRGRPCYVVSQPRYAATGFTQAILRGATYVAESAPADRLRVAAALAAAEDGALVYAYIPELDTIGHARGWESEAWTAELETLDGAVRDFAGALPADVGAVVTADHGMVDVPAHRHILLDAGDPLLEGVRIIGGEPRLLHLYAEDGESDRVLERWRAAEAHRSWVFSRAEAIAAGLFGGSVSDAVAPRIGDVLVAARAQVAYYDDRLADKRAQRMIGQHGSLTDEERVVPLLALGAFATD